MRVVADKVPKIPQPGQPALLLLILTILNKISKHPHHVVLHQPLQLLLRHSHLLPFPVEEEAARVAVPHEALLVEPAVQRLAAAGRHLGQQAAVLRALAWVEEAVVPEGNAFFVLWLRDLLCAFDAASGGDGELRLGLLRSLLQFVLEFRQPGQCFLGKV